MANVADDFWLAEAVRRFQDKYASLINGRRVDVVGYRQSLFKFGRNLAMANDTAETIWDLGPANETYISTNLIDAISSSSASDTTTVRIEGHYASATDVFRFCIIEVALTGQTVVDLASATVVSDLFGGFDGALVRAIRVLNVGAVSLVGDVYVYQSGQTVLLGVPQDLSLTHCNIRGTAGLNQSNKCAATTSNDAFYIVTGAQVGVSRAQEAFVDFSLEVRHPSEVFRQKALASSARTSGFTPMLDGIPYLIVPPNSDIRMRGTSSTDGLASPNPVTAIAQFNGILGALI